ncbi:MAG TPA: ABC transporter ATP-binding protein [Myxococcaceae bacterium]|nr:ABC transporter ATP-binding protein [Myxococcaceae bacterium]
MDHALELREVVKRFGPNIAVNRVSLTVERGQCYGLIGPNGAGKTTTFSLMCGYLFPNQGEIRILGVTPQQQGALKQKVGVLPQDAILPPWSKVGFLLHYWATLQGLENPERCAREALDLVGLAETWNTAAQALSHGMAKRVSMAQALMGDPPVVLLDEPTSGLDPRIAAQIRQLIRDLKGKQTIVVSSHNLQELEELCDAAAILDRGTLVQSGSMSDLTSIGAEFRVQIARGNVPLAELKALRGCTGASLEPSGILTVSFDRSLVAPEEIITCVVALLAAREVLILSVSRGRKLEERVLQLT